jgi:soluble lytic murein transglycosylase-like protein
MSDETRPSFAKASVWRQHGGGFDFPSRFSADPSLYDQHIRIVSLRYGIDPFLIKAMIRTESDFDRYAISRHGAQGLMQLMPGTARDLNVINPFDPRENIDGGVRYLRAILDSFDGNLPLSLAAYNAGPNLVKRCQRIPAIPETVEYVKRVLYHYKGYRGYERGYEVRKTEQISLPSVIRVREMVTVN